MLSILIPVYNYHVVPLIKVLHEQCMGVGISFEILCQDDDSNAFLVENQSINELSFCSFSKNDKNFGRGKNRNILIQKAQFNWLLMLDSDTFPRDKDFIKKYLEVTKKKSVTLSSGGLCYSEVKPQSDQLLRWKYGKNREALTIDFRNEKPNQRALTSNLLIQKKVALKNLFPEAITEYGYEDLCFLSALERQNQIVYHINNPVIHQNLETSTVFLAKTETALKNLSKLIRTNQITSKESKIAAVFLKVKQLRITKLISWLFEITKKGTLKNLHSKHPSLKLFDWYKLGYLCNLNSK